jgi:hypothetical protein
MSMVCPQCLGRFEQYLQCPKCGVPLAFPGSARNVVGIADDDRWQHSPWGRLVVGLLVTQGLAYGLRMLCDAGLLATSDEAERGVWSTLFGIILLQGLQGVSLLIGGALAGAGQTRGTSLGALLGILNGLVLLGIQYASGETVSQVLLYGTPILHMAFGALGGLIGSLIWRPLPTIVLATAPGEKRGTTARVNRSQPIFAGPVAWPRVVMGTAVVVAGVLWPKVILEFVLDASQGKMSLNSHMQAELVTWEITALFVAVGAGIAGAGTANGLKQGLCVAIGSLVILTPIQVTTTKFVLEHALFTAFTVVGLSLAGAWFARHLFPPVLANKPRRLGPADL